MDSVAELWPDIDMRITGRECQHAVTTGFQKQAERFANLRIIVDDVNGRLHDLFASGKVKLKMDPPDGLEVAQIRPPCANNRLTD